MEALRETVRQLVALVLVAGALEMMLPQGGMRGYVRVVMGLLVMLTVINPLLAWRYGPVAVDLKAIPDLAEGRPAPAVGAAAARLRAAGTAAVARAFRERVARAAADLAREVPGVAAAAAQVNTGPVPAVGAEPPVVSVRVYVQPGRVGAGAGETAPAAGAAAAPVTPVAPVDPADGGGAAQAAGAGPPPAGGADLVQAVRARVSAGLGLAAERVLVVISTR